MTEQPAANTQKGIVVRWRQRFDRRSPDSLLAGTLWGRYHDSYDDVARYFDHWADRRASDALLSRGYEQDAVGNYHAPRVISERMVASLPPGARVLDIGCGTGLAGAGLVRAGHRLTGIDISPRMARKALDKGYEAVLIDDVTAGELPWRRRFDGCICVGVLGEWISADVVLPKLIPALREQAVIGLTLERRSADLSNALDRLRAADFAVRWQHEGVGFHKFLCGTIHYHYIVAERKAAWIAPS